MDNILNNNLESIVKKADEMALRFKEDDLKTHQLRNFYSLVSRIRQEADSIEPKDRFSKVQPKLVMLQPRLAYAAGRQKSVRKNFYPFIKEAIAGVRDNETLERFFILLESIVAYHKFHGGE